MSEEEKLPKYILDELKKEIDYCLLRIDQLKKEGSGIYVIPLYEHAIRLAQIVLEENSEEKIPSITMNDQKIDPSDI